MASVRQVDHVLQEEDLTPFAPIPAMTLHTASEDIGQAYETITTVNEFGSYSGELEEEGSEAMPGYTLEETLSPAQDEDEHERADDVSLESSYAGEDYAAESPFASYEDSSETPFAPEIQSELDEGEEPYVFEEEAETSADFRRRAADIAKAEALLWGDGAKQETDPAMRDTLRGYWRTVRPESEIEKSIDERNAWSAAFISTVMKRAGAGDSFKFSAAHYVYAAEAKRARFRGDTSKCWMYRIDEVKPEFGDVVCRDRAARIGGPCSGTTYDNVDDGQRRATHGDVVTEVRPESIMVVGGNVRQSVKHRSITLDARGFVAQVTSGCKYFAILKPAGTLVGGVAPTPQPTSGAGSFPGTAGSLSGRIADVVRNGMISVQAGIAIAGGLRDENKLTNLVFFGRHPELPSGYKIQLHEQHLMREWTSIRNDVIRPLLRALSGGLSASSAPATLPQSSVAARVNAQTVARIDGHRVEIERAAASGVPTNVIRGIVAAESGGKERTGEGGSGYKGLMQAERTADQLDASVSLRSGTKKYKDFTVSMRKYFRETLGTDFDALSAETRIRIVMAAYNAGPGTVKRAMRFARDAGNVERWLDPEHYLRALVSYGAYNPVPGVLQWCVKQGHLSATDLASDLARLSGKSLADLQRAYQSGGTWSVSGLAAALKPHLFSEKTRLKNDGSVTFAQASQRASKSLLCAARFKQAHTGGYLDTVVRYIRYYDGRAQ